jgi:acetyltransferase
LATVDYRDTAALVATPAAEPEHIIAVARFAPRPGRPGAVEMAIVVTDAFQGQGIGRHLFSHLVTVARDLGHQWMLVETQADNHRMIELAESAGLPTQTAHEDGALLIWMELRGDS